MRWGGVSIYILRMPRNKTCILSMCRHCTGPLTDHNERVRVHTSVHAPVHTYVHLRCHSGLISLQHINPFCTWNIVTSATLAAPTTPELIQSVPRSHHAGSTIKRARV